jgi:hypothetical protein
MHFFSRVPEGIGEIKGRTGEEIYFKMKKKKEKKGTSRT